MLCGTQRLAELLELKHLCLVELRNLGLEQAVLIAEENMSAMLRGFASKQRTIEELQSIEKQLDPFRGEQPEARIWTTAAERRRCADLIANSQQLLDEIVLQEKRNEDELRARRDGITARLQSLQTANQARQAYAHPMDESAGLNLLS